MAKKIIIVWIFVSLAIAMATTFMQIWPATIFIDLTESHGKFYVKLVFLITWLMLILPIVLPYALYKMVTAKNRVPENLTGLSGIIIHRPMALQDAVYDFDIYIDEQKKESVANGKSTFVQLGSGTYALKITSGKKYSVPVSVTIEGNMVSKYKVGINTAVMFKFPPAKEGFLLVTPQ